MGKEDLLSKLGEGEIDSNAGGILETKRGEAKRDFCAAGRGLERDAWAKGHRGSPGTKLEGSGLRNRK